MKSSLSPVEFAIGYHKMGWNPIPMENKKPKIKWKHYQERMVGIDEIKRWSNLYASGIGIITGRVSNLVVIDIDDAKEYGWLVTKYTTATVKTKRGYHLYFSCDHTLSSISCKGVDIKAEGGIVVAPPTEPYQWVVPPKEIKPLPREIEEEIVFNEKIPLKEIWKGVRKGNRNNSCARLAGSLARDKVDLNDAISLLLAWNTFNNPPLPEQEIIRTVRSIYSREFRNNN